MVPTKVRRPTGVLLVNLGTPDAPRAKEVRSYLRQFLSDPRVIDIPRIFRALLLYLIILPFRPQKSAEAYGKIWTKDGSPLLAYGKILAEKLGRKLGQEYLVRVAMRYGNPSLSSAIDELVSAGAGHLVIVPLYPQYASSSTGSTTEEICRVIGEMWNTPSFTILPAFYGRTGILRAFAEQGRKHFAEHGKPEHVLMSFHGLPERHITKSDSKSLGCLKNSSCCDNPGERLQYCYRAQCFATARGIAEELDLKKDEYTVCFQSRLGRTPWVKPYTDEVVPELAARGISRVAVFCPAFVADCLETIEEIGMRAAESFEAASSGKGKLTLVPSLNDSELWVQELDAMIREATLPN
jgi:ferrochelatase